jgi:hypothetical protein
MIQPPCPSTADKLYGRGLLSCGRILGIVHSAGAWRALAVLLKRLVRGSLRISHVLLRAFVFHRRYKARLQFVFDNVLARAFFRFRFRLVSPFPVW